MNVERNYPARAVLAAVGCGGALLFGAFVYFYGLDGGHIPRNGDENPYIHIARLTAASGRLLPLQSQMWTKRNTKPPLLFWQGIASTGWGRNWTLWNLRYPNAVYTLLTAALALLLARRLSGRLETGVMAFLIYLSFLSTYRYGRPFLTDPGLVFWLFLSFFILIYRTPAGLESRLAVPLSIGIALGIGLLYKSFALAAPVGLALAWSYLQYREYRFADFARRDGGKAALSLLLALSIFALWFLVDPDPASVWREFVVGENVAEKFDHRLSGYLATLLWGSESIWRLLGDFLANAGLLIFPVAALFLTAFRERRALSLEKRLLWIWVIAFLAVFSLPSQRDARYLLPVMPALAVLLSLDWERLSRKLFLAVLSCSALLSVVAAALSLQLLRQTGGHLYHWSYWLLLGASGLIVAAAMAVPSLTRPLSVLSCLLALLLFAVFVSPLDGPMGNYSREALKPTLGKQVWVPCNFLAKDEGHRFVIPGSDVHGYEIALNLNAGQLAGRYPFFAFTVPMRADPVETVAAACPKCRLLGKRLQMRGRHSNRELAEMLFGGKLFELLFVRELLIESPQAPGDASVRWLHDECR